MTKDYAISRLRCLATLMIVVLHIIQRLSGPDWITDWMNIGVTWFFCISAFLYAKKDIANPGKWLRHRAVEIMLPGLLVALITISVYSIWVQPLTFGRILCSVLSGIGLEAFVPDSWMFAQNWFLTYILVCYLLVPILQKVDFKNMKAHFFWGGTLLSIPVVQGLSFAASHFLGIPTLNWGILLRFILPYALYRRQTAEEMRKMVNILTFLAIPVLAVCCFLRYACSFENSLLQAICELFYIYTQTLVGFVSFYLLYHLLQGAKERQYLHISDRYSYCVYLTHCMFVAYSTALPILIQPTWLGIVIALFATAVAAVAVYHLANTLKKRLLKMK